MWASRSKWPNPCHTMCNTTNHHGARGDGQMVHSPLGTGLLGDAGGVGWRGAERRKRRLLYAHVGAVTLGVAGFQVRGGGTE